jgi:hypothetical protein
MRLWNKAGYRSGIKKTIEGEKTPPMVPLYVLQNYHPTIPVIVYENGKNLSMKIFIIIFTIFAEIHIFPGPGNSNRGRIFCPIWRLG